MQLTLDGKTMVDAAIERLQANEPPEGYHMAFSGGKDSIVLYDLAEKSGVRFEAFCNITGIEPPELIEYIIEYYPMVEFIKPRKSFWRLVETNGLPTRKLRWCCKLIKEVGGKGRTVLTGIRWEESSGRKSRQVVEDSYKHKGKKFVHPIIDWASCEIWDYIKAEGLTYCSLYDEGFHRLGCVLCPMHTKAQMAVEALRWPKKYLAWHSAALRFFTLRSYRPGLQCFRDGEDYWQWWLSKESVN